jgi:opacity protein-like surface antigen
MDMITQHFLRLLLSTALAVLTASGLASAQLSPPTEASYGGSVPASEKVVPGIAWYGVLKDGLAEAKRTGKPILLITAAPQCSGVPGMW